MENTNHFSENDIEAIRALIDRLAAQATIVDFEEQMLIPSARATLRSWKEGERLAGFAYVDNYNNLWFETAPDAALPDELESKIIAWGMDCIRRRNAQTGENNTLDCSCRADHAHRIRVLEQHGFAREPVRSLHYARSLAAPIVEHPIPAGFAIRCVQGEQEVDRLVALHRAAFGTDYMTIEARLAIMRAPQYLRAMDFVAVAPNGELAAFCVCGFNDAEKKTGYAEPIGAHPRYQRMGLGKAIVTHGLKALKGAGAETVELGTSSTNLSMQKLAGALGFERIADKLWFSKNTKNEERG